MDLSGPVTVTLLLIVAPNGFIYCSSKRGKEQEGQQDTKAEKIDWNQIDGKHSPIEAFGWVCTLFESSVHYHYISAVHFDFFLSLYCLACDQQKGS